MDGVGQSFTTLALSSPANIVIVKSLDVECMDA